MSDERWRDMKKYIHETERQDGRVLDAQGCGAHGLPMVWPSKETLEPRRKADAPEGDDGGEA